MSHRKRVSHRNTYHHDTKLYLLCGASLQIIKLALVSVVCCH